jgi:hypothetical protein
MSMSGSWNDLVSLTAGARMVVERVRLPERGIALEGAFELPALAQLGADDQVFVVAFVKSHGSIKEMERLFGVSYPTIKARLNRLAATLGAELDVDEGASTSRLEILDCLERGEISARDAAEALKR